MKIYVIVSSRELSPLVEKIKQTLIACGLKNPCDWRMLIDSAKEQKFLKHLEKSGENVFIVPEGIDENLLRSIRDYDNYLPKPFAFIYPDSNIKAAIKALTGLKL